MKHITCVELQHHVVIIVGCVDPDGFDSCSLLSFGLNNEDYIIVESIHLGSVNWALVDLYELKGGCKRLRLNTAKWSSVMLVEVELNLFRPKFDHYHLWIDLQNISTGGGGGSMDFVILKQILAHQSWCLAGTGLKLTFATSYMKLTKIWLLSQEVAPPSSRPTQTKLWCDSSLHYNIIEKYTHGELWWDISGLRHRILECEVLSIDWRADKGNY